MAKPKRGDVPSQPDPNEQSGSAGRNTSPDKLDQTKDTGQDRYGQSGYGGAKPATPGKANYRKPKPDSNRGSGRLEHEQEEYRRDRRTGKISDANPADKQDDK